MRPLPENHSSSPSRRPTMRLRDPLTTYKSFETSTGASASPSPSANGRHSNASSIRSHSNGHHHTRQPSNSPVSSSARPQHRHSSSASTTSQHSHRDSQSSNHLLLHRTTSLDSLANSSEDPEDDINTTTTEDDVCGDDDDDDLSDVDSIGDFGSTTTTTTAQVHRKSDLETVLPDEPSKSPAIIKAYLESSSAQRNYKACEFKRRPDADEERKRADKLFARDLEDSFNHELSVDSDGVLLASDQHNNNGTMSSTVSSSSSGGSGSGGSSGKSTTRRLSVASSGSMGRMETIIEEPPVIESKVSVKEILARFETLNSLEVWPTQKRLVT